MITIETDSSSLTHEAELFVDLLKLQPHPEGGYFAQIFKSDQSVKSIDASRYDNQIRFAGTSIYYLLDKSDFSAWHKLKSDEIWHYYKGCEVIIYQIDQYNHIKTEILGDPTKNSNATFQISIPSNTWFSAELIDKKAYCLLGCTVSPGFEFIDFELGNRDVLLQQFPQHKLLITQLTRVTKQT